MRTTDFVTKENKVKFEFFRDGALHYSVPNKNGDIYLFQVEVGKETKGGIFNAEDKSLFFMRFIRKAVENKNMLLYKRIKV